MARICKRCGRELGFFSSITREGFCIPCDREMKAEREARMKMAVTQTNTIIDYIARTRTVNEKQYAYFASLTPPERNRVYISLVDRFLGDGELDTAEAAMLEKLYARLALDPIESTFLDRVVPSLFVASIRHDDTLPVMPREPLVQMDVILKKGELLHYLCRCVLKEKKIVRTGYVSGSQGVSIRVMKGVTYHVGGTRGHITKEEQLVETSRGTLLITSTRLFLSPDGNNKPLSIPISKILSYRCYDDGVVLYKDGREKPFVLLVGHAGEAETIGICLSHLTSGI